VERRRFGGSVSKLHANSRQIFFFPGCVDDHFTEAEKHLSVLPGKVESLAERESRQINMLEQPRRSHATSPGFALAFEPGESRTAAAQC
jgi:hypothetical protein